MKVIRLLLVLAIIAFGVSRGLPWVMGQLSSARGLDTSTPGGACVALVQQARDDFGKVSRAMRSPPYDLDAWDHNAMALGSQLSEATGRCGGCQLESCRAGLRAVESLRELVDDFGAGLRGETMLHDLNKRIWRVDSLLREARSKARTD